MNNIKDNIDLDEYKTLTVKELIKELLELDQNKPINLLFEGQLSNDFVILNTENIIIFSPYEG